MQSKAVPDGHSKDLFAKYQLAALCLQEESQSTGADKQLVTTLSSQLMGSYEQLEQRVNDLASELATVSEQRLAELTEKEILANRLEALIQALPGGVVVLDSSGKIIESNPVAESLLEHNLNHQYWRDVVSRCFMPRQDDGHEVSNHQGQRISIVTRSLDNDGQIILLTDQTPTRRLQAQLSRHERLSALGQVVSTLAHQIRTPLSSAMLYANHLTGSELTAKQQQDFTKKLKRRLEFMERQVSDMLLFVKGEIPLNDEIPLTRFKESLIENIVPQVSLYEGEYDLHVKGDCVLKCNHDALIGAMLNLVTNSLQTVKTPKILFNIEVIDGECIFTLIDNGPGMKSEAINKATELFFTTKEQGTGIGLSVVNHVVQSHGGRLHISNSQAKQPFSGLCVQIHLPTILSE